MSDGSVFRIGHSHYAPCIEAAEALEIAEENGGRHALVVSFHSDLPLRGYRDEWPRYVGRGYMTNNYGWVFGQTYVIPVNHALGTKLIEDGYRDCFRLPDGTAIGIDFQPGCPECPTRAKVVEVPDV